MAEVDTRVADLDRELECWGLMGCCTNHKPLPTEPEIVEVCLRNPHPGSCHFQPDLGLERST